MNTNKPKTNWVIDAGLFAGLLIAGMIDFTGVVLHQWLGLAVGLLAGYHLLVHWEWVEAVTLRYFTRTSGKARVYYLLDASLFLGFFLILATGFAISTWLDLPWANYDAWKNFHILISVFTLLIVLGKIAAHWRWIVMVARKYVFPPPPPASSSSTRQPGGAATAMDRREFLRLMGLVGAASVIAVGSSWDSVKGALAGESSSEETTTNAVTQETVQDLADSQESQASSSSSCRVQCRRGCSYPGRCRR